MGRLPHAAAVGPHWRVPGAHHPQRLPDSPVAGLVLWPRSIPATVPGRVAELETEFVRVYADTADYFMETLYETRTPAPTPSLAEEGNLTQALGLALESRQWDNAQLLTQPLAQVYRMQKRYPELRRLRRQLLDVTGATAAEAEANGATELWMYLLGTEASECLETNELDRSDSLNRQLLDYFASQPDADTDPRAAAVYHQMGEVALRRWRLDEAEEWYTKSLAIIESGEDRAPVADDYYGMGQLRQYQRRYTEARDWFSKSLDIHQRLEDVEEMVKDYRSLGLCAQFRFEYQEAESWYHRAREILEEARDEETSVLIYHALGTVAHAQYQLDDAENWYKQALTLCDRMGNEAQMAVEFPLPRSAGAGPPDVPGGCGTLVHPGSGRNTKSWATGAARATSAVNWACCSTSRRNWRKQNAGTTAPARYSRKSRISAAPPAPTASWEWPPRSAMTWKPPWNGPPAPTNWPPTTTCPS